MSRESKKTTIRTFRVDAAALEIIEKDAKNKKISVNTLVNQLLLAYANHDRYLEQFPMVKIPSNVLGSLFDGLSDEFAKDAGKRLAENLVRAHILSIQGDLNLGTFLAQFRIVSDYGKIFTLEETEVDRKRTVTLYHRFGRKGSLYLAEFLISLFGLIDMQPKITTTELSVAASIESLTHIFSGFQKIDRFEKQATLGGSASFDF